MLLNRLSPYNIAYANILHVPLDADLSKTIDNHYMYHAENT